MIHYNSFIRIYYYFFHAAILQQIYSFLDENIDIRLVCRSPVVIKKHNQYIRKLDSRLFILRNLDYILDYEYFILTFDLCYKRRWGGPRYSKNSDWEGFPSLNCKS